MLNNILTTNGLTRKKERIRKEKVKNDIENFQIQFEQCITIYDFTVVLATILATIIGDYLESNKDLTDQEKNQLQEILKKIRRLY